MEWGMTQNGIGEIPIGEYFTITFKKDPKRTEIRESTSEEKLLVTEGNYHLRKIKDGNYNISPLISPLICSSSFTTNTIKVKLKTEVIIIANNSVDAYKEALENYETNEMLGKIL